MLFFCCFFKRMYYYFKLLFTCRALLVSTGEGKKYSKLNAKALILAYGSTDVLITKISPKYFDNVLSKIILGMGNLKFKKKKLFMVE